MLNRNWRSGEIGLIALGLILAVAALTATHFFIDRVQRAITHQSGTVLAADLVVEGRQPLPDTLQQGARAAGLKTAQTLSFRSMLVVGEALQLAEVKAVGKHYPLRGDLSIRDDYNSDIRTAETVPAPGTAWLDTQLLQNLKLDVGDPVQLGDIELTIAGILIQEPDRGGEFFHIAPRLMMAIDDVLATGLIGVGSQARYRLLMAGPRHDVTQYHQQIEPQLDSKGIRLRSIRDAQPQLRTAIDQADKYLGLAALISAIIAGIAIAISTRIFAKRQLDQCAILRTLGATQTFISQVYLLQMLCLGMVTSALGCLLGFFGQSVLVQLLADLTAGDLPQATVWPVITGFSSGLILLIGFAMPPIMQLKDTPPSRVLRRQLKPDHPKTYTAHVGAMLAVIGLVAWQTKEFKLTVYVLIGSVITVAVLALLAFLMIKLVNVLRYRVGVAWRYGITNIGRRARGSVVQIVALGLGLLTLLLLGVVRTDLLASWRANLPTQAPNHFVINIQQDLTPQIANFFSQRQLPVPRLFPIIHGRLKSINNRVPSATDYSHPRARRLATRQFHLTWMDQMQTENTLVEGQWWPAGSRRPQWSIEADLAQDLGIKLGDEVTFTLQEQPITAPVTSIREVNWGSFQPNFFFIGVQGMLDDLPTSYMTSFFLATDQKPLLTEFAKAFPSTTVLDVAALMAHVRTIMDKVALAVEFIFIFTLLAGILVLFAAIQASHDERLRENAVLRVFGANRATILKGLASEYTLLGLAAGSIAALGASLIGYVLATYVFEIRYVPSPWLFIAGPVIGGVGVGLLGLWGMRKVLNTAPVEVLSRV